MAVVIRACLPRPRGLEPRAATDHLERHPHRILALLEGRRTDDAVRSRAVAAASLSGGYLTLVSVVAQPFPTFGFGPVCCPAVSFGELYRDATRTLARIVSEIPGEIALLTAIDQGSVLDVIARRVEAAAHDLVIFRRRDFVPASGG
ncbi:MAG TPA: hypothetical protein VMT59_10540 [Gaiellaceae bacterium]|nr:hypothetical protein [Gaiellaceae bacterium]